MTVTTEHVQGLDDLLRATAPGARLRDLSEDDITRMQAGAEVLAKTLASDRPVYGVTRGFGPLVVFAADDSAVLQGSGLISHLASGQGRPLPPEVCRLVVWLRLSSMRHGYSAVSTEVWRKLADLWNRGFVPAIPQDGTVSASGDLQPLAHAALAFMGRGEAWVEEEGQWRVVPAGRALAELGADPLEWPAREALAFVNGASVGLAVAAYNHQSLLRMVRAGAMLTSRAVSLLGANPEAYHEGLSRARGQSGQAVVAQWIREGLRPGAEWDRDRPLQEPYSLRCAPQVLGAVLDQLHSGEQVLAREAAGCTDNPVCVDDQVLHGGNFHAMPVGLVSDQSGLCLQQIAYLAERQLALLCSTETNGGLPPMLTPRPGSGSGLAGVQLSATSFVAKIRQLVYPASLTTLPTNNGNQDHVPMALNGATAVSEALELGWLVIGSLGVALAQLAALSDEDVDEGESEELWASIARACPPLDRDRPLAEEVRAVREIIDAHLKKSEHRSEPL